MGWDYGKVKMRGIQDKKAMNLIGESLHLGSIGIIMYLVFLSDEAPWWSVRKLTQVATPVSSMSGGAVRMQLSSPKGAKRARRVGMMPLPKSCRPRL
jgi:hypothetical protein